MERLEKNVGIPKWAGIVKMERGRVISVDWEKDFLLLELSNNQNEVVRDNAYKERKKLYDFLTRARALCTNGACVNGEFWLAYKRKPFSSMDYKVGPSIDGKVYRFKDREIAHEWTSSFKKRNEGWEVYIGKENGHSKV